MNLKSGFGKILLFGFIIVFAILLISGMWNLMSIWDSQLVLDIKLSEPTAGMFEAEFVVPNDLSPSEDKHTIYIVFNKLFEHNQQKELFDINVIGPNINYFENLRVRGTENTYLKVDDYKHLDLYFEIVPGTYKIIVKRTSERQSQELDVRSELRKISS